MRKHVPYVWAPECQAASDRLKQDLTIAPVLVAPDYSKANVTIWGSSDCLCVLFSRLWNEYHRIDWRSQT